MTKPASIAVLGPGPTGALLARLAADGGRTVSWWAGERAVQPDRRTKRRDERDASAVPAGIRTTADAREALGDAPLVLLAVSAGDLPALVDALAPRLGPDRLVVHAAKGLDGPAGRRPSELIAAEAPARRLGALAGPFLPTEVSSGYATTLVVASRFDEVHAAVREALGSARVRVQGTHDLLGVELAGASVVALGAAAGLCAGLRLGAAARAVILARGFAEATRLGTALGGKSETFAGPAGLADLLVTVGDADGLGYRFARRVGAGEPAAEVREDTEERTEAVRSLQGLTALAQRARVPHPTLAALREVLVDGADPRATLDGVLRDPG
jgi:glycerol-3-phosphate dehydrogenase (NAD(P)+)